MHKNWLKLKIWFSMGSNLGIFFHTFTFVALILPSITLEMILVSNAKKHGGFDTNIFCLKMFRKYRALIPIQFEENCCFSFRICETSIAL